MASITPYQAINLSVEEWQELRSVEGTAERDAA